MGPLRQRQGGDPPSAARAVAASGSGGSGVERGLGLAAAAALDEGGWDRTEACVVREGSAREQAAACAAAAATTHAKRAFTA